MKTKSRKSGLAKSSTDLRAVRRDEETLEEYAQRKIMIAFARRKARNYQIHVYEERLRPSGNPTNKRVEVQ